MDREAWRAATHGVAKSRTRLSDWTELNWRSTGTPWPVMHKVDCKNKGFLHQDVWRATPIPSPFRIKWIWILTWGRRFFGTHQPSSRSAGSLNKVTIPNTLSLNARDPGSTPGLGRSPGEGIRYPPQYSGASLVAQMVNNPPTMRETWVRSLGWEDPAKWDMATCPSILAWRIPMDRGAWWITVHGVAESQIQLSN